METGVAVLSPLQRAEMKRMNIDSLEEFDVPNQNQLCPSNRSDTDPQASKKPMVIILDNPDINPLQCSNVFKWFSAMYCSNCPSSQGGIRACCHLSRYL